MLWGIGSSVPFSFLGFSLSFISFATVLLIIVALKDIFEAQDIVW